MAVVEYRSALALEPDRNGVRCKAGRILVQRGAWRPTA